MMKRISVVALGLVLTASSVSAFADSDKAKLDDR